MNNRNTNGRILARNGMAATKMAAAICFLVILLSSCARPPQPTHAPLPIFTPKATITQATTLPTRTMTARPTVTETPIFNYIYTMAPWEISYEATVAAIATQAASFRGICEGREFSPHSILFSSDGDWLGVNCDQINLSGKLQVLKRDGSRSIEISYKDLYADLEDFCAIGADPLHWTANDQYLFFSRRAVCWESGGLIPLGYKNNGPLYRLDTQSGDWEKIIADETYDISYYFSPTDRRVVYIQNYHSRVVNILDLKTGDTESFPLPDYIEAGGVVWSPDGTSFAFTAARPPENADFEHMKYSVFIYDMIAKNLWPMISDRQERRITQEWTKDDLLIIPLVVNDYFYQIVPGQTLYFDLNTNSFITPSLTVAP